MSASISARKDSSSMSKTSHESQKPYRSPQGTPWSDLLNTQQGVSHGRKPNSIAQLIEATSGCDSRKRQTSARNEHGRLGFTADRTYGMMSLAVRMKSSARAP